MNVTPLDLRQQHFRTSMRGFDRNQVIAFLVEAADDYEAALKETERLRQEVTHLAAQLAEHQEHERNLRNTLLTAQRLSDEIRENAQRQAAEIKDSAQRQATSVVKEAEGRASLLLEKAQARLGDVQREIDGLRLKRRETENGVESLVANLKNTLDFIREQDARDNRPDKVAIHLPRHAEPHPARGLDDVVESLSQERPAAGER